MDDEDLFWKQYMQGIEDVPTSAGVFMGEAVHNFQDDSATRPKVGKPYELGVEERSMFYDCKDDRLDFTGSRRILRSRFNGDQGAVAPKAPKEYAIGGIRIPLR
jgi:hypothetical protein